MQGNFSIQLRRSNGNVHLRPRGDLDGSSAWVLIHMIHENYNGKGRIFVDTQDLHQIHPFGCNILKYELTTGIIPPHCLFFKGQKGFEIAPNGSRVIVAAKRSQSLCDGNTAAIACAR
jgi:hypothetical protein